MLRTCDTCQHSYEDLPYCPRCGSEGYRPRTPGLLTLFNIGIALLLVMLIGRPVLQAHHQGRRSNCASNLKTLSTGLDLYAADHDDQLPGQLQDLVPKYLKALPVCSQPYLYEHSGQHYRLICLADHHQTGSPPGYPRWDSDDGYLDRP
ncbi:MAG: hypothetical protein KC910_24600 [Candidatus Eremiobacteraeota bacterium]|nr:hypothetical protein [Candidatus Eremiobacteraeota bacterium]